MGKPNPCCAVGNMSRRLCSYCATWMIVQIPVFEIRNRYIFDIAEMNYLRVNIVKYDDFDYSESCLFCSVFTKKNCVKTNLAFPPIFRNGGHLRSKAMRVEGPVTDVTQEIAVVLVCLATVLAPLALLALPTTTYDRSDPNMSPSVVVVLKKSSYIV